MRKTLLKATMISLIFVITACSMGAPVPTATPIPTNTPVPPTATETPSPTLTPTPVPMASVNEAVDCYAGPSEQYDKVASLENGAEIQIVGQSDGGAFWIIATEGGSECWLAKENATVTAGEVSVLPLVIPPATPTLGPPAAPSELVVANVCHVNQIPSRHLDRAGFVLTWNDNSNNEDGFIVYKDDREVKRLPSNSIEFKDDANLAGPFRMQYSGPLMIYSVAAFNSAGVSNMIQIKVQIKCP